jgi:serine/threonine protein kinase
VYDNDYHVPPKVDIFGFGFIPYEMIIWNEMFPSSMSAPSVMRQMMNGIKPMLPQNVHESVVDIILRCLNVDPDGRPTFCDIVDTLIDCQYKFSPM